MALRGKKPEAMQKRLKLFMFGPAGVGKTTAARQMPKPYIIDTERGTENYAAEIEKVGGAVFQTTEMHEVITEVRSLLTEKHDYLTLVIDPVTAVYNDLIDKCEKKVGSEFGRHIQAANKEMKRLANLINALDMNICMTAHAKKEYGDAMKVLGNTYDGWKNLEYWFDLVIQLNRTPNFDGANAKAKGPKRFARVEKSRIATFPDMDVFEWSYDELKRRYDAAAMERAAVAVTLATPAQVTQLTELLSVVRIDQDTVDKWLSKAGVDSFEDMPGDVIQKCIDFVQKKLPTAA